MAIFYFYPLAAILRLSFAPQGAFDLGGLGKLFSPYYLRVVGFTFWQAALSTLLTLAAAMPAAYAFARYDFPLKSLLRALSTIPFIMPTVVVAAAFAALVGPNGRLNLWLMQLLGLDAPPIRLLNTVWIILIAHVFYNYTVILRGVGGFWANLDPRLEQAAAVLGAGKWQVLRQVSLPLLLPAIIASALLVFLFDFTSFGVVLILGGPKFATLEVEIYQQADRLFLPMAAALSLIQLLFTLAITSVYTRLQAQVSVSLNLRPHQITHRSPTTWQARAFISANIVFMFILLLSPLLALVERSLQLDSLATFRFSLSYFRALFTNPRASYFYVPPIVAIGNSLLVAGSVVFLSLMLGLIAARFISRSHKTLQLLVRWIDPLFMLPLGTSAITLGFGYIVALDRPPLDLRASPLLLPLAHTLIAFPFVVRSLLPVLRGINPHIQQAAEVLGASSWQAWREVDLPIIGRALIVSAVFAFTISLGEFGATAVVTRPEFPTMPVVIYRFLGQPGALNYGQALAMSTLLMVVCAVGIVLIERVRAGEFGEF